MNDVIDLEIIDELLVVMGDDMAEFIGTFITYSAELLGQMSIHAERGDAGNLLLVVHSFKGSSKNIGATVLGDLLFDLEMTLRDGTVVMSALDPSFPVIQSAYEDVCTALQIYLG